MTFLSKQLTDRDAPDLAKIGTALNSISKLADLGSGGTLVNSDHARKVLSMEGFANPGDSSVFATTFNDIGAQLAVIAKEYFSESQIDTTTYKAITQVSLESAKYASVISAAPRAHVDFHGFDTLKNYNGVDILRPSGAGMDYFTDRSLSMEAFDNTPVRQVTEWTTTYALGAVRQNAFAQAFWLPLAVSPEEPGLLATIRARYVQPDIKRNIKGLGGAWDRKPLIHALVDSSILHDDQTDVIPVFRDGGANDTTALFVDADLVEPQTVVYEGVNVTTSYLKFGAQIDDLIGLGSVDALIANGLLTAQDNLDTSVQVRTMLVKFGDDIIEFNVEHYTGSNFNYSLVGNNRLMVGSMNLDRLLINERTKTLAGGNLATLAAIAAGNYQVRVGIRASGEFNLETSAGYVDAPKTSLRVTGITTKDDPKTQLSLTAGPGLAIANLIAAGEPLGYKLSARRINTDRRNRGQIIDTMEWRKYYSIPLRSPITAVRSISAADQGDADLIQTLLETTFVRASTDAVKALFRVFDALLSTIATGATHEINPDFMGMASRLVTPYAAEYELDALKIVDSLTSTDRTVDIQAAFMGVLRDKAYDVMIRTNYLVALSSVYGGQDVKPTMLLGTDPRIAAYLNIPGESRLMGPDMAHHVVSSTLLEMRDTIFMTFADYSESSQGRYNAMHFGHFVVKPEVVTNAQISRGQQTMRELTVMPSYIHIPNLPILIKFTVKNLDAILKKNVILTDVRTEETPA